MIDEKLINLMYDGAIDTSPWSSFLYELRQRLNSISSHLMFGLPWTPTASQDIGSTEPTARVMRRAYYNRYCRMNPIQYQNMEYGRVYSLDDFVRRDQFVTTPYYQEFCQVLGIDHSLTAYIGEVENVQIWLAIARGDNVGAYRPDDAALVLGLVPHMQRALKISGALKKAKTEKSTYMDALNRMKLCTVLLDEDGRIVEMNDQAERLLSRSCSIQTVGDRIAMTHSPDQLRFNETLKTVISGENKAGFAALTIGKLSDAPLDLIIRRTESGVINLGKKPSYTAIIYLKNRCEQFEAKADVVAELYGLTLTEARLAIAIVNGASVKEAASALKMSELTVRTYVKRILQKTGMPRQSALVNLIGTGLAAMA